MGIDAGKVASLSQKDDATLRTLVQQDSALSRALFASMPALAEDAGFEPFSKSWINRYWRNVLGEVTGKPVDKLYDWALQASAASVAALLVQHFGLEVAAYSAAIALAILLLRAAKATNDKETPPDDKKNDTSG